MTLVDSAARSATAPIDPMRPLLVNAATAARILCIGRTALSQLIWNGELTPIHIGRSVRFPLTQLEDFVHERMLRSQ